MAITLLGAGFFGMDVESVFSGMVGVVVLNGYSASRGMIVVVVTDVGFCFLLQSLRRFRFGLSDACGCLVFRDVQGRDDFLLTLRRSGDFFSVLERMIELPGQIPALFAVLIQIGLAFAESVFDAFQCVLDGGDGAGVTVADIGFVFAFAVDAERGTFFKPVNRNGKSADAADDL